MTPTVELRVCVCGEEAPGASVHNDNTTTNSPSVKQYKGNGDEGEQHLVHHPTKPTTQLSLETTTIPIMGVGFGGGHAGPNGASARLSYSALGGARYLNERTTRG